MSDDVDRSMEMSNMLKEKSDEISRLKRELNEVVEECARIAESEPWPEGPVPAKVLEASANLTYEQIIEATVKATRESIARKIRHKTEKRNDLVPKCICSPWEGMHTTMCPAGGAK